MNRFALDPEPSTEDLVTIRFFETGAEERFLPNVKTVVEKARWLRSY